MYILRRILILTGWPWYHCGLNFSSLLRVKDAFLLGSYILLSIIPWDSGYSPCNWEDAFLQWSKQKEPSTYSNMSLRIQIQQHHLSLLQSPTSNPDLVLSEILKKIRHCPLGSNWKTLSSCIYFIFSTSVPKTKQLPTLDLHHMSKSSSSRKPLHEQSKNCRHQVLGSFSRLCSVFK